MARDDILKSSEVTDESLSDDKKSPHHGSGSKGCRMLGLERKIHREQARARGGETEDNESAIEECSEIANNSYSDDDLEPDDESRGSARGRRESFCENASSHSVNSLQEQFVPKSLSSSGNSGRQAGKTAGRQHSKGTRGTKEKAPEVFLFSNEECFRLDACVLFFQISLTNHFQIRLSRH